MKHKPSAASHGVVLALCALALYGLAAVADQNITAAPSDLEDEFIRLETGDGAFEAIFRARQQGDPRGGLILLHDENGNADSLEVIRPLRLALSDAGWDTLSLQLSGHYRDTDRAHWLARGPQIVARLTSGIDWLKGRGIDRLVILAQGASGTVALQWVAAQKTAPDVRALVLVSTPWTTVDEIDGMVALRQAKLPILDIYAQRDIAAVVDTAAARRLAAQEAGNTGFRQRFVAGATPGFRGLETGLLADMRAWLAANTDTPGAER